MVIYTCFTISNVPTIFYISKNRNRVKYVGLVRREIRAEAVYYNEIRWVVIDAAAIGVLSLLEAL